MKVLNLSRQRSFHLIHILAVLCHEVAANTEIITFSSSREPTVDLPLDVVGNWSSLRPTDNERRWSLEPAALHTPLHHTCERADETRVASPHPPFSCPHELWLFLDLDDERWASHSAFSLRLSWPASTPADFAIALFSPQDVLARLRPSERASISSSSSTPATASATSTPHARSTRSRYARIRAVHAGVPTPGSRPLSARAPDRVAPPAANALVLFLVILEPVYWGVLPATLLPTVGFLVPIVLAAIAIVPWVTAYLEPFVRQARGDVKVGITRADKAR